MLLTRTYSTVPHKLLQSALKIVPQVGWSDALLETARSEGLSDIITSVYTPSDLVNFHYQTKLNDLSKMKFNNQADISLNDNDKIRDLLKYRLLTGNKHLSPSNISEMITLSTNHSLLNRPTLTSAIADEIWYLAGDQSTDTDWYTKRGSLAGLYSVCEHFQAHDTSREYKHTLEFMNSLVDKFGRVGETKNVVTEWTSFTVNGWLNALRAQF